MDQDESIILSDDDQDDSMPDIFRQKEIEDDMNRNRILAGDPYSGAHAAQQDFSQAHPYDINTAEATSTRENYGAVNGTHDYHYIQQPSGGQVYPEDTSLDNEEDEEEVETGQRGQVCSICGEKRSMNVAHECRHSAKRKAGGRKRVLAQSSEGEYMCSDCPYTSERYQSVYQHCKNLAHKIMKIVNNTMVAEKVQIVEQRNRPIPVASLSSMRHPAEQPAIRITNGAIQLEEDNSHEEVDKEGVLSAFATVAELVTGDENPDHMISLDDLEDDMEEDFPMQKSQPRKSGATARSKCPVDPNSPAPKKLPDGQFQCNFCQFKSRLCRTLVKHQWTHTDFYPYQCVACHKRLRNISQHKCKVTGQNANISSVLPIVPQAQPGPSGANMEPATVVAADTVSTVGGVRQTNEQIPSAKTGGETVRTRGSAPKDPACPRPTRGEDGMFQCNICDFKSKYSQSTIVHQWRHTGFKPYKCHVCKKSFIQKALLKKHVCRLSNPNFRPKIKIEPKTEPLEEASKHPVSAAAGRPGTEENTYMQPTTHHSSVTSPIEIAPPLMINAELPVDAHLSHNQVPTTTHPHSSAQLYAADPVVSMVQSVVSQLGLNGTEHSVQMSGIGQSAANGQLPAINSFSAPTMTPHDMSYSLNATTMPASAEANYIDFETEMPVSGNLHALPEYDATNNAPVQSNVTPASVHMPTASAVNGGQHPQMAARPHPASAFEQSGMSPTDAVVIPDDESVDTKPLYTSYMSVAGPSRDSVVPLPPISNPMIVSNDLDPASVPATPAEARPSNPSQVPQVHPAPQISPSRTTTMTQPIATPTSNLYKCPLCKIYFEDEKMYRTHMDHHGQDIGRCAKCSSYFSTPLAFFNHMECQHKPRAAGPSPVAVSNPLPTNTPRGSFRGRRSRSRSSRGRGNMGRPSAQYSANPPQPTRSQSPMYNANPGFRQPPPGGVSPRNPNMRQNVTVDRPFQSQNPGAQIPSIGHSTPTHMDHRNARPVTQTNSGNPNSHASLMSRPSPPTQQGTPVRPGNSLNRPNNGAQRTSRPDMQQMPSAAQPGNHSRRVTGITPIHRSPITDTSETRNSAQGQQRAPQPHQQTAQHAAHRQSSHQRAHGSQNAPQKRMAPTSQQMPSHQMSHISRNVPQASPQIMHVAHNPMPRASQKMPQKPVTQTSPQMPPHQMHRASQNMPQKPVTQTSPQMPPHQMPRASQKMPQKPVTQTSPQMPPHQMARAPQNMPQMPPNQMPRASQNMPQTSQQMTPLAPRAMPPQHAAQMPVTSPQMPPHPMPRASSNMPQMPVTQASPPMPPLQMPHTSQNALQSYPQMSPEAPHQMSHVSNQSVSRQNVVPSKPHRQVARRGRPLSVSIPQHQPSTSHQMVSQNPASQQYQNNPPKEPERGNVIVID